VKARPEWVSVPTETPTLTRISKKHLAAARVPRYPKPGIFSPRSSPPGIEPDT